MNDIHFAQKLKKARSDLAITQQELADKLHVSRKTVSGWETGRTRPDIDMLRQIAELCHISLDELVYDSGFSRNKYQLMHKSEFNIIRLTTTSIDIILAVLIVGRITHNTIYDSVFIMLDSLIYFTICLRLLSTRWGLKVIHSVRSLLFLVGYSSFAGFTLYSAFTDTFKMELAFKIVLGICGLIAIVNLLIILLRSKEA